MTEAFTEIRFPEDIAFGSRGGPEYSTNITEGHSGIEQRNINWSQARGRYNVSHGIKTQTQLDVLLAFFRARKGRALGFRFKDWTDYKVQGQVIGSGNGTATEFQLIKSYVSGSITEIRNITKPVPGTIDIYLEGVLQEAGVSVNTATGKVTFALAPAQDDVITADFEFDVPVRFDTDALQASMEELGTRMWNDIPLVEIRT